MKKRFVTSVVLLALVLTITSCGSTSLKKSYTINESSYSEKQEFDYTSLINNELTAEELITKPLDIHDAAENYFVRDMMGRPFSFLDFYDGVGVECLRKTDAGALYSVHKIKQGGKLYVFYEQSPDSSSTADESAIRWFYVHKVLSSQDFEGIQEGSTIEDVKKIDPAIQIYENLYNASLEKNENQPNAYSAVAEYYDRIGFYFTNHYLTDGVLELFYKNENGKLVVRQKQIVDDFALKYNDSIVYPYDGHLLPIDQLQ